MAFPYRDIDEVKLANKNNGLLWFSPDTMRCWGTKISPNLYTFSTPDGFRQFFITADRTSPGSDVKRYTVREAKPRGNVSTFGEFLAHPSNAAAKSWLFSEAKTRGWRGANP